MDQGKKFNRDENPRETASIFSVISFFFTYKIFKKGYERELDNKDVYEVRRKFKSSRLGDRLEECWNDEKEKNSQPSLLKVVFKCYGGYYVTLGLIQLFMRTGMAIYQPIALGKFVAYFEPGQITMTISDCYYYAFLVIILNLIHTVYNHNFMQVMQELGVSVRGAICSKIYRKTLRLSPAAQADMPMGKIVTLITKDVFTYDTCLLFFNDMWIGFIQIGVVAYMIYRRIGFTTFSGIGFLFALIPIELLIGKETGAARLKSFKQTDKRLQIIQEVVSAIKIIKMYTWEKYFGKKLVEVRKKETNFLKKIYYLRFTILIVGALASRIGFLILILTYALTGHLVNAELVYFIQSCFQSLRSYITVSIPLGITQTAELLAASSRISKFLNADEINLNVLQTGPHSNPRVYLDQVSANIRDKQILKSVSLNLEKGLLVVTGNIGSGKSSLLKTILGEMQVSDGKIQVDGSISYVPQEPWLFPSTIRQNILFGEVYVEERYREVLNACALNLDLNQLSDGDNTVVSDKGVNLSKGQQARICLARAIYKNSDIYLLDDCLTALDSTVSQHIFKECILELLKDKICIFVTHNINYIKQISGNVLFIENGTTLTLSQQKDSLDKRITYFMDEGAHYDFKAEHEDIIEEDEENVDESDGLLEVKEKEPPKDLYYEENKAGKISWHVYRRYCTFAGGYCAVLVLLLLFFIAQASVVLSERSIAWWVNVEAHVAAYVKRNMTNTPEYETIQEKRDAYLYTFTIALTTALMFNVFKSLMNFSLCIKASKKIHKVLTDSVLNTFMSFFDTHFVGNIVNRFSKDFSTIDELIPFLLFENLHSILTVVGIFFLISSVNPIFMLAALFLIVVMYYMRKYYIPTGRAVKRLEASTRSPMIGYLNASIEGLPVIRAYGNQSTLISEFDRHQDLYSSAYYMMMCSSRAFGFVLDVFCSFFLAAIIMKFSLFRNDEKSGDIGMTVSQALMLTGMLQWTIKNMAELENNLTSVERVMEYTDVKKEDKTSGQIISNWPSEGRIEYKDVYLTYKTSNELVLKGINFEINGKAKIGIVGRTGAGKSSIISTLFRLYEVDGSIFIDDINIKSLPLDFLRSSIAIIPQDPVLFTGTIRDNIDPLGSYSDSVIWNAIEKVNMKHIITDLSQAVRDKGSNFSSGQRQLLCLARALISKNKIVVLDEATANMDPETDALLQNSIKENFSNCTVLTIAHRLHTVINCEKVMVVDGGMIVQYDAPAILLEDKNGAFYRMVKQSGLIL